ncbi:hypothetical protein HUJ04_012061 [Dendroctonus ponderosae]|nr:hypothetical protein HUJ04_012061 [Dendroctonus ponderosae]
MELCKKQCIVLELEKSVDNFNETLRNFDSTAEELACENTCLKSERARLLKKLEILQQEISVNNAELVKMKNQTQINNKSCSERNKALEQENEALKNNLLQLNTEKRDLEKDLINNCHKQMEVENMKQDYTRRASSTAKKLDDLQTVHSELKSLFDKTYAENKKLRAEFKNHAGCKEDLQQLLKKTEFLQSENEKLTKQADSLKTECNQLRKECATRCLEAFTLKEAVENEKQQNRLCDENCQELKQKQKSNEVELVKLREQLDKMCEKYEQKSEDLKKVQKQWESCAKQCQISKDEYNNLRKEYKDIKAMLTDQIKKYKVDGHSMEAGRNCKVSKDIKEELMKKENEIITLHQKLRNASCEIIELKDYVQKLICDNHLLKSAINGLISNLENKIKGPSFGSLPSNSAEIIAGEILNSLTTIEDIIVKKGDSCPGCPGKYCDCMSEITQQYSYKSTIKALRQRPLGDEAKSHLIELFNRGHSSASAYHTFCAEKIEIYGDDYENILYDRLNLPMRGSDTNNYTEIQAKPTYHMLQKQEFPYAVEHLDIHREVFLLLLRVKGKKSKKVFDSPKKLSVTDKTVSDKIEDITRLVEHEYVTMQKNEQNLLESAKTIPEIMLRTKTVEPDLEKVLEEQLNNGEIQRCHLPRLVISNLTPLLFVGSLDKERTSFSNELYTKMLSQSIYIAKDSEHDHKYFEYTNKMS